MFLNREEKRFDAMYTGRKSKTGLRPGVVYPVKAVNTYGYHTTYELDGFDGREFNDKDFIPVVDGGPRLSLVIKKRPHVGQSFVAFMDERDEDGEPLLKWSSEIVYIVPQTVCDRLAHRISVITSHYMRFGGPAKLYRLQY